MSNWKLLFVKTKKKKNMLKWAQGAGNVAKFVGQRANMQHFQMNPQLPAYSYHPYIRLFMLRLGNKMSGTWSGQTRHSHKEAKELLPEASLMGSRWAADHLERYLQPYSIFPTPGYIRVSIYLSFAKTFKLAFARREMPSPENFSRIIVIG